ncbi:Aste57867_2951 [Aphanomyces stellatus]|uniref:Aste57867_2951 protein n=1 Tax=Aphanomyces stellatus TaxID=120398 RepID=A0A485K8N1_9STRA|nr:hypothetical protein As57867_002942 [Aphanomyces stellatus]VFT80134.1 Aste57867_2951 [Aphanomyces stellatus]
MQYKLLIPLMQRRYCWDDDVLLKWWQDMTTRTSHRIGQLIVRLAKSSPASDDTLPTMLIVDGQQRLTATTIMASALRHELMLRRTEDDGAVQETIDWLTRILFLPSAPEDSTMLQALQKGWAEGKALDHARLTHSFLDRRAYAHVLVQGGAALLPADDVSPIAQTKHFFDARASTLSTADLCIVAKRLFESVSLMLVDIQTRDVNLAQIFHWLQAKHLSTHGLLNNPSPGVWFSLIDLLRNVFMANFIYAPLEEQERVYRREWIPFELHARQVKDVLVAYIRATKTPTYVPPSASYDLYNTFMDIYDEQIETTPPMEILRALVAIAAKHPAAGDATLIAP